MNRLASETSPYLLQHQHNPVDWYAWGAEAERHRLCRQCIAFHGRLILPVKRVTQDGAKGFLPPCVSFRAGDCFPRRFCGRLV